MNNLNQDQLKAVTSKHRAILVIAGAGSGKTKVLVERIRYLLQEQSISPFAIMAVTFTNKAANEMKERLAELYHPGMWIGTFHSICAKILRIDSQYTSFDKNFIIYDADDSRSLLKKSLIHLGIDDKKYTPQTVSYLISDAKNSLIDPPALAAAAANEYEENIAKIYYEYQKRLRANNALDFDDILVEALNILQNNPDLLYKYQSRFHHILVDEYQDTNHCQYCLIKLLTGQNGNLFVVGDPDQSIYRWRGADISNILDFEKDYPDCQTIKLVENYRSTQNILSAANSVIAHNKNRKEKDLFSNKGEGEKITFHLAENDKEESRYVIENIANLLNQGYTYHDFAVLYRTHSQSRALEEECIRYGLPYRIFGGIRFYERKEIKDSIAYLRAIANPYDQEAITRIYNTPKRGIGKDTWDKIIAKAGAKSCGVFDILSDEDALATLNTRVKNRLAALKRLFEGFSDFRSHNPSLAELLCYIWDSSGYKEALLAELGGDERWENLEQLFNIALEFDRHFTPDEEYDDALVAFLARVALATDMDNWQQTEDFITFMTLHSAKGLEFPIVFIIGMEEGLFPHKRSIVSIDKDDLEEERRLCYVGITRAKERLFLLAADSRYNWGEFVRNSCSRFLKEIPQELLKKTGLPRDLFATVKPQNTNIFIDKKPIVKPQISPNLVNLGDKVEHSKFGVGVIVSISGSGDDMQVGVAFPNLGIKQLIWRWAPLKKIN
ncbi:MAG: ATP-dependent helicase [Bacillota bacterium]|jgi:DNA helicase-2/ATP-dependent DNA helicase PcrA